MAETMTIEASTTTEDPTLNLQAGLSVHELHRRLRAAHRATDLGHRTLAFYLHDMQRRGVHASFSCSSAAHYAEARLGLGDRLARELVLLGERLLELEAVDRAFAAGFITWSKVRLLCRVAVPETQATWIERARELSCRKLGQQLRQCVRGDAPPSERGLGLPELRFLVEARLSALQHEVWEQAKKKLSTERSQPVTDAELLSHAAELILGQTAAEPVSRSRYQVVVHQCPDCGESAVDSELGRIALSAEEAEMVACDAERRSLHGEGDIDHPTPDRLRRAVIARDAGQCLHCGSRIGLHVHHVQFRALGGPTAQENLATLCIRCHSLVHHGALRVEGTAPHGLRFLDDAGRPLPGNEPADPLVEILVTGEAGTRVPNPGPEPFDLDTALEGIPDGGLIDADWFWANQHRFQWKLAPPGRRAR